ncbi:MAG: hypothetical protein ACM3S5_15505 [Rhodospirillales bacterium]
MRPSALFVAAMFLVPALGGAQEEYKGPRPPKPDVPYLVHADTLIETEVQEASETKKKDDYIYTIAGSASPARTPLAEPIFLLLSEKLSPDSLELYRLEVKGGNRQVTVSPNRKRSARPLRLTVTRLADKLYRLEVNEGLGLENGEYSLSPNGSNTVFCFEVY